MSISTTRRGALGSCALALLLAFAGVAGPVRAQELVAGWDPRSGDVWVDTWLGDVNRYGQTYQDSFVDELVRYHHAPRPLVVELLERRHWAPGDVYYACAIASIIGRPCRYVVDYYEAGRGQGWGALAQQLGIKPGSDEFHRLKKGFVPTYDRWARPIELDDELERVYPERGKGKGGGNGKAPASAGGGGGNGQGASHGKGASDRGKAESGKSHGNGQGNGKPDKGGGKGKGRGKG